VRFAREGRVFIALSTAVAALLFVNAVFNGGVGRWTAALLVLALALWTAYFFRDPERTGDRGPHLVVAPADGKVVLIGDVDEPAFLGGSATRISIFMNVFSVHVNRYPVAGVVRYVNHARGRFRNAAGAESSAENEQMSVGVDTGTHRVLVRQIAGLIARRIVTYGREGDEVAQGDRMGLIRFGSRVDVFLPARATLRVRLGDVTAAGATVLAELPAGVRPAESTA
jgi:phosphatidylserine decarboxylase